MTIKLEKMNSTEFHRYLNYTIENYANEHVRAGNWKEEEAISKATIEFETLLPKGEKTKNNSLLTIRNKDQEVGMIWLAQKTDERGFIYDINIWENHQGKGFGKEAMSELEVIAKRLGIKSIGLHVFAHNQKARHLYEKLGYVETNINMKKIL